MKIETFQKELELIGGFHLSGKPYLRVVNGLTELAFVCGEMIPKYRSGRVFRDEVRKFRLRHMVTGELKDCTYEEAKKVQARADKLDKRNKWIGETSREVKLRVEGLDRFVIEQFFPPEEVRDTPASWEAARYQVIFDERQGKEVLTDMIGPFPFEGRYEYLMATKYLNDDVLTDIQKLLRAREQWKQTKSNDLMIADVFQQAREKERQTELLIADMLKSEIAPHAFRGLYLSGGQPWRMWEKEKQ
jgi:hypothetical protein